MMMFARLRQYLRNSQLWASIVRQGVPTDDRSRIKVVLSNLLLHLHPVSVRHGATRVSFTWCMGGITCFLFLFEAVTGILLMFYYRPSAEYAYMDIVGLGAHVPLGLLRELHRWGAHLMVITCWLHMLRVFLTGSYKPPREFNWAVGVCLLVLTMLLSFTGYLLPWDQLALWAVTVGTNMAQATPFIGQEGPGASLLTISDVPIIHENSDVRAVLLGGSSVGPATLLRFYVLHCIALPVLMVVLMAVHFWRVRKDGGISGPL